VADRLDDRDREQIDDCIRCHARNCVAKVEGVDLDAPNILSIAQLCLWKWPHRLRLAAIVTSQAALIGEHWKIATVTLASVLEATMAKTTQTGVRTHCDCTPRMIRRYRQRTLSFTMPRTVL
jgi:hypothetical protein